MTRALRMALALIFVFSSEAFAQQQSAPPGRQLSLKQAIELALKNNLNLEVSRVDPAISRLTIDESRGAWNPGFSLGAQVGQAENPFANPVLSLAGTSGTRIDEGTRDFNGGFAGLLPWGLSYSSIYGRRRVDSSSGFNSLAPEWRARWNNELTVPLLRDLYWNDVDLAVRQSYLGRDIADENFRQILNDTLALVEAAYWNLTARRESERVSTKSLETARAVLEQTQVQYEVGVVSKVNVAQAEAGVAQREFDLIVDRNAAMQAQDTLLNLILAPGFEGFENAQLRTQPPTFLAYEIDAKAAMEKAFARRPELEAARRAVESAEMDTKFARNQVLPALDLAGSLSLDGLSGTVKPPDPQGAIPEGGSASDNDFFRNEGAQSWTVGATLEIPFGNDVAEARFSKAKIELRRARSRLRVAEQDVIISVRNAVREFRNSIDGVKAAERNVNARSESLRAEEERLRLGDSTPRNVLEVEEDLAEAEQQEIGALQAYANAITALERAQSTLLETRGVSIIQELERAPSPIPGATP